MRWAARLRGALRIPSPRVVTVAALAVIYLVLTVAVLSGSDVDGVDTLVFRWAGTDPWPSLHGFLSWWVLLGQRGICGSIAAVWFGWVAVRRRDLRPLITLVVVTLVLNLFVGAVKLAIGRLGPLQLGPAAGQIGATRVFDDGTIFPSGHTANAVVIWGLMAMLAVRHRRRWAVAAGFVAATVGLTTVYLGTHWISDVLAGWAAGGLVLLAVPSMTPIVDRIDRLAHELVAVLRRRPARVPLLPDPVFLHAAAGPRHSRPQASRPAEARLLVIGSRKAEGGVEAGRVRIGDHVEPMRAAASG